MLRWTKAKDLCDQIHRVLLKYDDQNKDQKSGPNKSIECFMADVSLEACKISSDDQQETPITN